jgi:hypothetical protein
MRTQAKKPKFIIEDAKRKINPGFWKSMNEKLLLKSRFEGRLDFRRCSA